MKRFLHPSERELTTALDVSAGGHISIGCPCACFSSSKSSTSTKTTDSRVGASDHAVAQSGSQNTQVKDGVLASGGGEKTATAVGGSAISNVQGPVTVTTSDPLVVKEALKTVTDLAAGAGELLITSGDRTNALLAQLSESKATDGASSVNRNIVYVSVAALAVLAFAFYNRKT